MWILISETIIFAILIALIIGYFGNWGLGVNKEVYFNAVMNKSIEKSKKMAKEKEYKYNISRINAINDHTLYHAYKITLLDKSGHKLPEKDLEDFVKEIFDQQNNSTNAEISPYVDSTLYPITKLSLIEQQTQQKDYTLAFITSNNGQCDASWGGYYTIEEGPNSRNNGTQEFFYDEIKYIQNLNGKLTLSFGGASGTPLFVACSDENNLLNQYERVIDKLHIYDLDFDIEGGFVNNVDDIKRLISVLEKLQEKYPQITLRFTLPVDPDKGFTDAVINNIIKPIKNSKLKNYLFNVMVMYFSTEYDNQDLGQVAIQAVQKVNEQLKQIYGTSSAYSMIGITPMIGLNTPNQEFTLADAKNIAEFASENGIPLLSYWDINRDHPCADTTVQLKCSSKNLQSTDYEYLQTFRDNYKPVTNSTEESSLNNAYQNNFLIYYGWPSVINGSNGDIEKAEKVFEKYKKVILGWGLEENTHPDYQKTKQIISDLQEKVEFYGYVPMVDQGNMNYEKIKSYILKWKELGVKGIFLDEAGHDYSEKYYSNYTYTGYVTYLRSIYNFTKIQGLEIILNSWYPEDIYNNITLHKNDGILIERYDYYNNIEEPEYIDHVNSYKKIFPKSNEKPYVLCIATGKSNDQQSVNNIKNKIGQDMANTCNYMSIQDDYGTDYSSTVLTPTN